MLFVSMKYTVFVKCACVSVLMFVPCSLFSQTPFKYRVLNHFTSMWTNLPQEKVYLHTDKSVYSAGESVWFKAYLVNATTHFEDTKSRFIYVELINSFDSVISRVKIKKDSLGFSGHINVNAEIAPGDYLLRAYTYWMQNTGTDFFFSKLITIGNLIDDRVHLDLNHITSQNGARTAVFTLLDANKKPLGDKNIQCLLQGFSKKMKPSVLKTNSVGRISVQFPDENVLDVKKCIQVSIDEPYLKFSKQFAIPTESDDFDVQFFPESGKLIQDNVQTIAFKAIGRNGLSLPVSGKIYDQSNNIVAEITDVYKGMGQFSLFAQKGAIYHAVLQSDKGIEKSFTLPAVEDVGVSLKIISKKNRILYSVNNQLPVSNSNLFLLVHTRGILSILQPLNALFGQINEDDLFPGITSFSVVDSLGTIFCERLIFVKNKDTYNINVSTDKIKYRQRELVNMNFRVLDSLNVAQKGNFSLSVTDSKLVKLDSMSNDIQSYLLLSSDIKGHVEEPADFFRDSKIKSSQKLDLLMMTQCWRRFDLSEYLTNKMKRPSFYLEAGQALSGKVLNVANNPSKNCDVMLLSNNNTFRISKTDSLGQFIIDGIQFSDSTSFVLKARKRKSITDVEIIPDKDIFPNSKVFIPYKQSYKDTLMNDYLQFSKQKYYADGGMRIINLDELTVTAKSKETVNDNPMYSGADNRISGDALHRFNNMSVLNYLQTISGVTVSGNNISIRGSSGAPLLLIDGFESDNIEDITYLTTDDLDEISVFKGSSAAIFGIRGGNGAIVLTLRRGVQIKHATPISLCVVKPLGYQVPKEFYIPKYDVAEVLNSTKPDFRTTILWADKLKMDENGNIKVNFFTADMPNDYIYTFEGITEKGGLIHETGIIKRDN